MTARVKLTPGARCGAKTNAGSPCTKWPIKGSNRCQKHGGGAPQVKAAARERLILAKNLKKLDDMHSDLEPITDALGSLEELAAQAVGLVNVLKHQVSALTEIGYRSDQGFEQTRAELAVYMQALGRAESMVSRIVSLDLDEKRVRIQQAQAMAVVHALDRVLKLPDLGLPEPQRRLVTQLLSKELEKVAR